MHEREPNLERSTGLITDNLTLGPLAVSTELVNPQPDTKQHTIPGPYLPAPQWVVDGWRAGLARRSDTKSSNIL